MLLRQKKELEEEYDMQYINMQKQIINIWKIIITTMNHYIPNISMQTICKDGQCLKKYLQMASNRKQCA